MSTAPLSEAKPAPGYSKSNADPGRHETTTPPHGEAQGGVHPARAAERMLSESLDDAICLLRYAEEAGIVVEADLAQRIITAELLGNPARDEASAGSLFSDITKLGALLHPVTAVTLRACRKDAFDTIRSYKNIAICLALLIIPWSWTSYVFTGINNSITTDLTTANQLAVSLHGQLEAPVAPPGGQTVQVAPLSALSDLQEFAATIRSIYRHTGLLSVFILRMGQDPPKDLKTELDPDLSPTKTSDLRTNLVELTGSYQQIRSYAKYTQDDGAAVYGAVTACILPIFYALLGACAYLLRVFSGQLATRTFSPSHSPVARFVIAAITGGVVGLFNNFVGSQMATLSPLAVAFLAGYAADVFFAFLDGAVHSVTKSRAG
jgi:hypothetical protein